MTLSSDERYIFTAGDDQKIFVYYTPNMTNICEILAPFKVKNLKISVDSMILIAIGEEGEIVYWQLQS